MRKLSLHISALNDEEYELFTSSFSDLTEGDNSQHDDAFYERAVLSVREVRAWMRGRYANMDVSTVDTILKYFSSTLGPGDTISGGEFFAALRLIVHASGGKQLDRSDAFVQCHPSPSTSNHQHRADPPLPPRKSLDVTPPPKTAPVLPPKDSTSTSRNPFSKSPDSSAQTPGRESHNPFMQQPRQKVQSMSSSRSENSASTPLPPLPPRKPAPPVPLVPPPRHHSSLMASSSPPKQFYSVGPSGGKNTSTLIQQSLMAQKTAASLKKAEEKMEKERVLQVLKRSSMPAPQKPAPPIPRNRSQSPSKSKDGSAGGSSSTSTLDSDGPPPLPRRRTQTQNYGDSPPMSASSFREVAMASGSNSVNNDIIRTSAFSSVKSSPFLSNDERENTLRRSAHNPFPRSANRTPSTSPTRGANSRPPMHPDHKPPPPPKPGALSASSTPRRGPSADNDEEFEIIDKPPSSPPYDSVDDERTRAMRKRMIRSQSMHAHMHASPSTSPHNGSATPPAPPPRRKRPESVQTVSADSSSAQHVQNIFDALEASPFRDAGPSTPGKGGASLIRSKTSPSAHPSNAPGTPASSSKNSSHKRRVSATNATIQRTLDRLESTMQSSGSKSRFDFEKARYKAEAGIFSRRGFVPSSHPYASTRDWDPERGEDEEGLVVGAGDYSAGDGDGRASDEERGGEEGDVFADDADSGKVGVDRDSEWESNWKRGRAAGDLGEGWRRL